jgi:hypothetical protein
MISRSSRGVQIPRRDCTPQALGESGVSLLRHREVAEEQRFGGPQNVAASTAQAQ